MVVVLLVMLCVLLLDAVSVHLHLTPPPLIPTHTHTHDQAGFDVVCTASAKHHDKLKALGAAHCVDYHDDDVADQIKVCFLIDPSGVLASTCCSNGGARLWVMRTPFHASLFALHSALCTLRFTLYALRPHPLPPHFRRLLVTA